MSDTPPPDLAQRWRTRVERELTGKIPTAARPAAGSRHGGPERASDTTDPRAAVDKLTTRLPDGATLAPLYTDATTTRPEPRTGEPALVPWPVTPAPTDLDLRAAEQRGAAPAEELALALPVLLERPHVPVIHLGLSPDILLQIAKLRALRRLAARLTELDGLPRPFVVHAHTSVRHLTRHDPWVNQLRNSTAVFAALVGQADLVTPVPWDAPLGAPSDDAKRLAEHTVRIAVHESHLSAADPAFGSYALETLTETLCHTAWALAADPAALATQIETTRAERARRVARRADLGGAFVGATLYPDLDESAPTAAPGIDLGPRLAAPFERLRDVAHDQNARVFLATYGPLARHMARSTWVTHLCATGGIRTVDPSPAEGYASIDAVADAFTASDTTIAILSVADPDWGEDGATLVSLIDALTRRGAKVLVAGRPTPHIPVDTIVGFIHAGQPALDVIQDLHVRLFGGAR